MVDVSFSFHEVSVSAFKSDRLADWIKRVLGKHNVLVANLEYVFVSDEFLLQMNREHLGHDYFTDIITFNYNEEDSLCGEMYISVDRVRENAEEFERGDFERELCRVMIHGVLHLLGFSDETDEQEKEMRVLENECLDLL